MSQMSKPDHDEQPPCFHAHCMLSSSFFFFFYIMMSWPSHPDESVQESGKIMNKGTGVIHSPPADLWMRPLLKGFNELHFLCICRGWITDAVIYPFVSPFSMVCNGDGKGEKGEKVMTFVAQLVVELVIFQLPCCVIMSTIAWMVWVCGSINISLMTTFL